MTATAIKSINISDMKNIALGGAFLGTGGGGDPLIGRLMAEEAIASNRPVQVLDVEELDDDALFIPIAMMGPPTVMLEKLPRGDEVIAAVEAPQKYLGKKATAIFCTEAGGLNSTIPIAVAAATNLPIIDGDGMGRAFPELQMVSMTMGGVSACPMVMADEKGGASLIARTEDGTPKAITPDLICLLDLETGQPITTEQIRYGFRVIVFGLPCNPQWRSDHGLELVGPRYFGYELDYESDRKAQPGASLKIKFNGGIKCEIPNHGKPCCWRGQV